ncbi:type VI secretion system protein TssA [Luminiphilus sp. nBUS_16]|uniref:type VI secretion system protein TssA n=1 Tax=Luminiphilus sp. nBUS_16 TaxID=3395315 RepID=UPI003EBC8464
MNVEQLLEPISDDQPAGGDFEYDPAFGELERASQGKPSQELGDSVSEGEPPDWQVVVSGAESLLGQTKDLRLAVLYTHGQLVTSGFAGLVAGLELTLGLLNRFWGSVHPQLDPDDDNDPTIRANTLSQLADEDSLLKDLQVAPMISVRGFGTVSYRALLVANGDLTPIADEDLPDAASVNGCLLECPMDDLRTLAENVHRASELASEIQTTFDDLAPNSMLNLEKLGAMLAGAYRDIAVFLARRGEDVAGADVGADQEGDAGASKAGSVPGQISSRADVIRSLDAAIAYFRNEEPSSPVPLLLQRAKRLTAMDFLEIIRDMAPEGLDQIRNVGGLDSGDE